MQQFKLWLRRNGFTALVIVLVILLWVSPDAKAWVMRQIVSTGVLNYNVEFRSENIPPMYPVDFQVRSAAGQTINVADLKGRVVFINFWASWCPPCRAEFPSIQEFYDAYKDNLNLVFLTVCLDDNVKAGQGYLAREGYTVPFLVPASDIPTEIFRNSLPTTVVLDKNGAVRYNHTGMADYSSRRFYKQIDKLIGE